MPIEHILVDGYSILHQWPEAIAARARSLAAGRQVLIYLLTQFHDSHGGQLTLVFDGRSIPAGGDGIPTGIRVIYSKEDQTADAVIERMVGQSTQPETFLVATDDHAEQNVIEGLGGQTISADAFRIMVKSELQNFGEILEQLSSKRHIRKHH